MFLKSFEIVCYNRDYLLIPNTPYIAVYWKKSDAIEALRVLHTSMKWPDTF
jgi:cupin superfamily acireductone dioxygenase involved in methionine salvage